MQVNSINSKQLKSKLTAADHSLGTS